MARECGRRVHKVRIDQVALSTIVPHRGQLTIGKKWTVGEDKTHDERYKYKRNCQSNEDRTHPGNPPGHALIVPAPTEPEDADH